MTKQEQLEYIKKKYHNGEVCMYDLLASVSCSELGNDLTLEDAYELYVEAKLWADGDMIEKGD